MGPNLYVAPADADPMEALALSQQAAAFFTLALTRVVNSRRA